MENLESLIIEITKLPAKKRNREHILKMKRQRAKEHQEKNVPTNIALFKTYQSLLIQGKIKKSEAIENLLKKRSVRSMSGIVPVQVLTKPFWCPGKCIFCPNDASMPKSYINTQPGAMRALLNHFDPYKQVYNRLLSLQLTGHHTDKIEMIVLGGTRDVYPKQYKIDFIKGLYDACNTFTEFLQQIDIDFTNPKSARYTHTEALNITYPENIEESIKINETADHRIIGLTIETRPEYVTDENCQLRRELGVTRMEMGIQTLHNDVHKANKRGHDNEAIRKAMHKLRQYGFKISNHYMPGLYTSNFDKDLETFQLAFSSPWIKSDEMKFYPTAVIPNTELYTLRKKQKYQPMPEEDLVRLIRRVKQEIIPPYMRIKRLARDFDTNEVVAGANTPNLRQMTMDALQKEFDEDVILREKQYARLGGFQDGSVEIQELRARSGELRNIETLKHGNIEILKHGNIEILKHGNIETLKNGSYAPHSCGGTSAGHGEVKEQRTQSGDWETALNSLEKPLSIEYKKYTSLSGEERDIDDRVETYCVDGIFDISSQRNFVCLCTRCREMKNRFLKGKNEKMKKGKNEKQKLSGIPFLVVRRYRSSVGEEMFISFEDSLGYLYGFTRLLLPDEGQTIDYPGLGEATALVRELHVYGNLKSLKNKNISENVGVENGKNTSQHKGFGTQLMETVEKIATIRGYKRVSVIAGVGVRKYYEKKLGYVLEGTYMVKKLTKN